MFHGQRFLATVLVLIFFSCCALPSTNALSLDYNNICLLTKNGELIATGDSCTQYYSCQNGIATLQTCPNGLSFSKDAQGCQPSSIANCATVGDPCNSQNVGTFQPVANSCNGYYYCSATGGIRGNCPSGENFNPATQTCLYATQYQCGIIDADPGTGDNADSGENTGVNLCAFMPNGIFFGSASSCSDANYCQNNVLTTTSCPNGYSFNPSTGQCAYSDTVSCTQVTNDPNLSNSPIVGGPCTTIGTLKAATQCNAYYSCNGVAFQLMYCAVGYYYDTVSQKCVLRMNARNNCDRCEGTHLSFVNAYSPTSCNGYLFCQNGVRQSAGVCQPGAYFNEEDGACVIGDEPDYGCCNPAFFPTIPSPVPSTVVPSAPTTVPTTDDATEATEATAAHTTA